MIRPRPRTTENVMAHVQAERAIQLERWGWREDASRPESDWDTLIWDRLIKPGASRYVRLVQVAALAIAAAEHEPWEPGWSSTHRPDNELSE